MELAVFALSGSTLFWLGSVIKLKTIIIRNNNIIIIRNNNVSRKIKDHPSEANKMHLCPSSDIILKNLCPLYVPIFFSNVFFLVYIYCKLFVIIIIIYHDFFSLHQGGVVMSSQVKHTHSHQDTPLSPYT